MVSSSSEFDLVMFVLWRIAVKVSENQLKSRNVPIILEVFFFILSHLNVVI